MRKQIDFAANDPKAISWAQSKIAGCLDHHPSCLLGVIPIVRPKRLIHVGLTEGDQVKLVNTPSKSVPYCALSYCWGTGSKDHVLRKENLAQYRSCVPAKALLQMFRDAIKLTRALGVAFIWIDALCILQDDTLDWQQEAGKMCGIFKHSYLTLSALGFPDPNHSLFSQTLDETVSSVEDEDETIKIFCKTIDEDPTDNLRINVDSSGDMSQMQPTMSRGWCFQERLLSIRTLHITRHELYWDCCEERSCQCGHMDGYLAHPDIDRYDYCPRQSHHRAVTSHDENTLSKRWQQVVGEYSGLNLTRMSDKLAAIDGIATEIQQSLKSKYICGLFERTMLLDLCWHPGRGNIRFAGNPTWSWASMSGAVNYPWMSFDQDSPYALCEYLGVAPTLPTTNGSTTKDAGLLLSGSWTRGKLVSRSSTPYLYSWVGDVEVPLGRIYPSFDRTGEYTSKRYQDGSLNSLHLFRVLWLQPKSNTSNNENEVMVFFLILKAVKSDRRYPTFKRIGHGRCYLLRGGEFEEHLAWFDLHAEKGTVVLV